MTNKYDIYARFDYGDMKRCGIRECGTPLEAVIAEIREEPSDTADAWELCAWDDDTVVTAYRLDDGWEIHAEKDEHDDYATMRGGVSELVLNQYGRILDYNAAVAFMDGELCEQLHMELAPCTAQKFFDAYCEAHEQASGEEFELAKENPVW